MGTSELIDLTFYLKKKKSPWTFVSFYIKVISTGNLGKRKSVESSRIL